MLLSLLEKVIADVCNLVLGILVGVGIFLFSWSGLTLRQALYVLVWSGVFKKCHLFLLSTLS